ncbi:CARDB domain-containing protein [Paenibacillus naphthalenovorans]|uniref:glycoside hydrolase family 78 protein n=1 Tax=Paenibacillus naphthalenovorans TaxID=162209 RepID=UPI00087E7EEB|nr:CARDB domain-containing protein [Paenibacillus naphthalenovorans]SDI97210.1 CARDB protein [Paenibacillus naphthalenovorans]
MNKKRFSLVMLAVFLAQFILPFIEYQVAYAAKSKTMYIDFQSGTLSDQPVTGEHYSANSSWSKNIDLSPYIDGTVKEVTVTVGPGQTATRSISGNTVTIHVNGNGLTVYGRADTNPGHQIYRLPDGKRWEHKGANTSIYQFDPDDAASGGITQRPGIIPDEGYIRPASSSTASSTPTTYNGTNKEGNDLRYLYGSPPKDMVDIAPNWNMNGAAVTRSYNVPPPSVFYKTQPTNINPEPKDPVPLVDPNSIRLTGASEKHIGIEPYSWGYINGSNQIAVRRVLNTVCTFESKDPNPVGDPDDCIIESKNTGYGQLNNYVMEVNTDWQAKTYIYSMGKVEITYEIPATPDLAAQEIKVDNACIPVGSTQTIRYSYKNIGVSTSTAFTVQLKVDGVVVKTENASGGANNGVLLGGTYSYTFSTAAPKIFSLVVDSGNTVGDTNRSNNTTNETFTPQATCETTPPPTQEPGTLTGELTIQKGFLPWKENNVFTVETRPQGCELSKFKWHMSGNGGELTMPPPGAADHGWYPNTSGNTNSWVFAFDHATKQYPANMKSGTVTVTFIALDSCGVERTIGPKTFEIGPPPPNNPPQLRVTFVDTAGEPISTAIVGDTVGLKVTELKDPDGDPITFYWDFEDPMNTTEWVRGLPGKHSWSKPYTRQSYSGMTADVLGMQVVCAYAADGVSSTNACANLDVVPPNPIPKIKGQQVIKVGRPLTIPWDSSESYSPVKGRMIDHTKDEWINAKQSYSVVGTEKIQLHVYDNTGLKSLEPDTWDLTVIPDQPPVIDFQYSATVSRVGTAKFRNASYSPDGDTIVQYRVTYGYDANNNGNCTPTSTLISSNNEVFDFKPDKVGKYCFRVYAKEDYGKDAYKDYVVESINDSPEVSFTVSGETTEPEPAIWNGIPNGDFLTDSWINTTLDKNVIPKFAWRISPAGTLSTGVRTDNISSISPGQYKMPSLALPDAPGTLAGGYGSLPGITFFSTPDYYLGNNMFLVGGYQSWYERQRLYITGFHLPQPIQLIEFPFDSRYTVHVKEDVGEVIVLHSNQFAVQGSPYDITTQWKRYKIASLRGGNISIDASGSYRMQNSSGWFGPTNKSGVFPTYSDGSSPFDLQVLMKFNYDYKSLDLTNRIIKSYTFDNLTTPYKVETYTDVPSETGDFGGPKVHPGTMGSVSFRAPSGNIYFTAQYYMYKFDGDTGKITRIGQAGSWSERATISGVNEDETLVRYNLTYDSSVSGGQQYRYLDVATGQSHWATIPAGFNTNFDLDTDLGFDGDINGRSLEYSRVKETRTGNFLFDTSCNTYAYNQLTVISENLYIMCGQVYSFTPSSSQTQNTNEHFSFGQIMKPSMSPLFDATIQWEQKANATYLDYIPYGMSFRIQDSKNMYRLESMKDRLRLVKIVNGRKTTISEIARSSFNNAWYNYQIKMNGNRFRIYENGTLVIDKTDSTFSSGTFGPYSLQEYSEFKGIRYAIYPPQTSKYLNGYALVDKEVKYEHTFSDPENDPRYDNGTQWKYAHVDTTIFLDTGDGKSGLSSRHGQTVTTPILNFDKVGVYKIEYRAPDDPHPNHRLADGSQAFQDYSKYSDWYTQQLIVHRAPISKFTLSLAADNTVAWTDHSFDPDRCYAKGNCQAPYADNSGIYAKKFYYVTPSGNTVASKLVRPTESGVYTVYMAVQDEYGAWSDWYEQTITVTVIPPPNVPPTVTLTFPTGTQANPTPVSLQPTIRWNQADANPGTIFTVFNLMIKDEAGFCVECLNHQVMDTTAASWAWTMENRLLMGQKYSAQVQVSDGEAWSGWSNIGWMTTNRPPEAYMSYPYGTQANPTIANTLRPTLAWSQTDPDPGTLFTHFQIQITNEANTAMVLDSGKIVQNTASTSASWTVTSDLPAGQKLRVRVMVWDQYGAASDWSPQAWLYINRAPSGTLTIASPIYEHDTPAFTVISSDPDGDALSITVESSFNGGEFSTIRQWHNVPSGQQSVFTYGPIPEGNYVFRLTIHDGWGGMFQQTYSFVVLPLDITGWVNHTPEWESYRQAWNAKYPQRQRGERDFWAGEAFELAAQVTDTGVSATKPDDVDATLIETGETVPLTGSNDIRFTGQLLNTDHVRMLQNGEEYTFRFKVRWTNGLEQTTDVPVRIIGSMYDVIVNQIRH